MTTEELINEVFKQVSERYGYKKNEVSIISKATIEAIRDAISHRKGEKVKLFRLGVFTTKDIKGRKEVIFIPSRSLRESVWFWNRSRDPI